VHRAKRLACGRPKLGDARAVRDHDPVLSRYYDFLLRYSSSFLRFHGRGSAILHFEPIMRATRAVARVFCPKELETATLLPYRRTVKRTHAVSIDEIAFANPSPRDSITD
jgi:hypothetical protein